VALPDEVIAQLSGDYLSLDGARARRVELRDGKLFYVRSQSNQSELRAVGPSRLHILPESSGAELEFEPATTTKPARLIFTAPGEATVALEAYRPRTYSAEELQAFSGKYASDEFPTSVTLTVKDGKLFAQGGGIGLTELTPMAADLFKLSMYWQTGLLHFERNANGAVEKLRFDMDRVQNLYFIRSASD